MNIKRWMAIIGALLVLVACGSPVAQSVARVDNVMLTRQDLDQRIARIQKGLQAQPTQGTPPSQLDIERALVGQFIQQNLTLNIARQRGITISDKEIDDQIAQFRSSIGQNGSTLDNAVQGQLGLPSGDSTEFRQFVSSFVARQRLGATLVTTDTVRQQVTDQVMAEANKTTDQVHAAHILVKTEAEAQQVIDRLNKGEQFDALAKELSQDPGSATSGGDLGWASRGQFVEAFDKAIFDELKPGEVTKTPVQTEYGYHVIKVIERAQRPAMTQEQAQQAIEQSLSQQISTQRQQAVNKLIDDEHQKAKAEGRLVEPDYPAATEGPTAPPEPTAPAPPERPTLAPSQAQPTAQP